jgi:ABC-type multidrug transport system fused ATPase/permease subunit
VYQDYDVYLLDDVFSSLDVHVCEAIFERCIKGVLLARGKTVVLALSQYRFLKSASNIILLEDGQLITDKEKVEAYVIESEGETSLNKKENSAAKSVEKGSDKKAAVKEENELIQAKLKQEDAEKNDEIREEGSVKATTILGYISTMGSIIFLMFIFINYGMYGARVYQDFWLKNQSSNEVLVLSEFIQTLILLTLMTTAVIVVRSYTWCFLSMRAAKRIFEKLNHRILYAKMVFFDKNAIGRLISRLSSDIWIVDDRLSLVFHLFFENLSRVSGFFAGIIIQLPAILICKPKS